jgi:hypothetical protein
VHSSRCRRPAVDTRSWSPAQGVHHAQGYLIGEPVAYDDFVEEFMAPAG